MKITLKMWTVSERLETTVGMKTTVRMETCQDRDLCQGGNEHADDKDQCLP